MNNNSFSTINLASIIFALGTVIPAITLSDYIEIPSERYVFKGIGTILLAFSLGVLIFVGRRRISKSNLFFLFMIVTLPFLFAVSASIYSFSDSLVQWLRFIAVVIIVLFLSSLEENELLKILKIYIYLVFLLALISIYQYFVGYPTYEKFPLLNISSNKSIIFEQNVYGIFVYMSFLIFGFLSLSEKKLRSFVTNIVFLFGIFISFYRTIYAFVILRFFSKYKFFSLFLGTSGIIISIFYFSEIGLNIGEFLNFDQFDTLSGRAALWSIAIDSFYNAPILGLGENAIPVVSNEVLNRNPAYTTYHNVLLDVLAVSGIIGFLLYGFIFIYTLSFIEKGHRFIFLMLMAPALLNTYYAFMPNPLGGILGAFIFYSMKKRVNRLQNLKVYGE